MSKEAPTTERRFVHTQDIILSMKTVNKVEYVPTYNDSFLQLLPHFVPERLRVAMKGMNIRQMWNHIHERTNWKVTEITKVSNPHLEGHHKLFLEQHNIKITDPWTFHGAPPNDIENMCEWGASNVFQRRALWGYGEMYVGLDAAMARAYSNGYKPQILVCGVARGSYTVGFEKRKDYGQDELGNPNLSLTDDTGKIIVVKSRNQVKIEFNVTFTWGGEALLNMSHLNADLWHNHDVKESIYKWLLKQPEATPELLRRFAPPVAVSAVQVGLGLGLGRGRGSAPAAAAGSLALGGHSAQGLAPAGSGGGSSARASSRAAPGYVKSLYERKTDVSIDAAKNGHWDQNGKPEELRVGVNVEVYTTYGGFEKAEGQKAKVIGIFSGTRTTVLVSLYDDDATAYVEKQNRKKNRHLKNGSSMSGGFPYVATDFKSQGYASLAGAPYFFRLCQCPLKSDDSAVDKGKKGKRPRESDDGGKDKNGKGLA